MSAGQSQRIKELRAQLLKAQQYTYVWYTIACELAGKDAVDAAFHRVMEGGMPVATPEAEQSRTGRPGVPSGAMVYLETSPTAFPVDVARALAVVP